MEIKVVNINPALAQIMLGTNSNSNRKLNQLQVNQYANDMKNGDWVLTHQGIAFSENGVLVDGQHRLKAIIAANVTIPMMVATGLTEKDIASIDCGLKRTESYRSGFLGENQNLYSAISFATARCLDSVMNSNCNYTRNNRQSLAEKINLIDTYPNIFKYFQRKIKGFNRADFLVAILCSMKDGVCIEVIEDLKRFLNSNTITSSNYNYKAILDVVSYLASIKIHSAKKSLNNTNHMVNFYTKAISCFAKNRQFNCPYWFSKEYKESFNLTPIALEMIESDIERLLYNESK